MYKMLSYKTLLVYIAFIAAMIWPLLSWAQVLDSTWETQLGKMNIGQNGAVLEGQALFKDTKIQAEMAEPRVFKGKWMSGPNYVEPANAGDIVITFAPNGKSFVAKWRFGSEGPWKGEWAGNRLEGNLALTSDEMAKERIIQLVFPWSAIILFVLGIILLAIYFFLPR